MTPGDIHFFNENWQLIGNKRMLGHTLTNITGVSSHILTDGLSGNQPCVAETMSWAADWTITRVEDEPIIVGSAGREYADVVWGGKKGIPSSSARDYPHVQRPWSCYEEVRTGSILADDPSFFRRSDLKPVDYNEFIGELKNASQEQEQGYPRPRKITSMYTRSQIVEFRCGCSFVPTMTLTPSSKLGCSTMIL